MRQIEIELNGVKLTVSEAGVLQGIRRSILQEQAKLDEGDDQAILYIKRIFYPDLIAATLSQSGFDNWPLSLADFMQVPDQLALKWENAVYELNPHWRPGWEDEQQEKKASTSDSSNGSSAS